MTRFFGSPEKAWLVGSIIACALLLGALFVPLWRMELIAPQYPKGLVMYAYGYKFADSDRSPYDDVREINELNHYIGMKPIKAVTEMKLFIPGVLALVIATLGAAFVAWNRRWLKLLITLGFWLMPVFFLADLQFWLYRFGHTMDPKAALNTGPFTPRVVGTTKVWNFHSETRLQTGFFLMLAAALVITFVPLAARLYQGWRSRAGVEPAAARSEQAARGHGRATAAAVLLAIIITASVAGPAARVHAQDSAGDASQSLQQRIDSAAPEDMVIVDGGVFRGPIVINKSISLIGRNAPVIDGGGQGDVVTISADDVVLSGFTIRGGGKSISQEPAAVKVRSADRVTVRANVVRDARFGVHVTDSANAVIDNNTIDTGGDTPVERRGHGVYLWEVSDSTVYGNTVKDAGDGIHMEYVHGIAVGKNVVTDSRYALHSMYATDTKVVENTLRDNLSGAVLMYSKELILKDNELSSNRHGSLGTGILLKDNDNVWVEGNRILRNTFGMTVDGTPQSAGSTAIFRRNLYALNDTGIGLMSNAPITFVENAMIDNIVQVRALSGELSAALSSHSADAPAGGSGGTGNVALPKGALWSSAGRGNYWSDYRGFDANGDGVGDQAYAPQPPFAGRLGNEDMLRLFQFTPAQQAIDAAAQMFPVYRYRAVIQDEYPLMRPPEGLAPAGGAGVNRRLFAVSALLAALALAITLRCAQVDVGGALRRLAGGSRRRGRAGAPA